MFFNHLIEFGGFELNHQWHGINMLSVLECALLAALLCSLLGLFARFIRKSRRLTILSLIGALSFATAAYAANTALSALSASGAIAGANLIYVVQTAGTGGVKATFTQVATFINSLFSGDFTCASGGACTLKNTGPGATGPLGSTTTVPVITIDAQGRVTALTSATTAGTVSSASVTTANGVSATVATQTTTPAFTFTLGAITPTTVNGNTVPTAADTVALLAATQTLSAKTLASATFSTAATFSFITGSTQCLQVNTSGTLSGTGAVCGGSGSSGANPTATASDTAVNGSATTFMRSDAAPAVQKTSASVFGLVKVDGSTLTAVAGVASVQVTCGLSSGASGVGANVTQRNNTATTDTVASSDCGNVLTENNAASVAVTLPVATTTGFGTGFYNTLKNKGTGVVTLTPTTSTIDGKSNITLKQYQSVDYYSDGTNYWTLPGDPTNVACADLTNAGALCSTTPGTGVAAAAANNLSAAGGLTSTIASGTSALGTSAIASAACATVVTTAATNTATTDVVTASFNGDPTAVTGYVPLTTGMLTIIAYPTANNVNFKVCNNTSASITPGAITLNWRVVR